MLPFLAPFRLDLHRMEVVAAFLYEDLQEEEDWEQPEEFISDGKYYLVCRLSKSLYDLMQVPSEGNRVIGNLFSDILEIIRNSTNVCV